MKKLTQLGYYVRPRILQMTKGRDTLTPLAFVVMWDMFWQRTYALYFVNIRSGVNSLSLCLVGKMCTGFHHTIQHIAFKADKQNVYSEPHVYRI